MRSIVAVSLLACALTLVLGACGQKTGGDPIPTAAELAAAAKAAHSANGLCPVMGRPVDADAVTTEYQGQKIAFCCPPCAPKFRADPERYMKLMRDNPGKYGYTKP